MVRLLCRASVLVFVLVLTVGRVPAAWGQAIDSQSRVAQWRADVDTLTSLLARRHVDPFAHRDSAAWLRTADRLKRQIPDQSDLEVTLSLMRLVADLGDSHTKLVPWVVTPTHGYPFDLRVFPEGMYVTRVLSGYEDLLGARLVGVGETPVREAFQQVSTLYASENKYHRWHFVLPYLRMAEPLYGLGLLPRRTSGVFTFEMPDGTSQTRTLTAKAASERPLFAIDSLWTQAPAPEHRPRAWHRLDEHYWFEVLEDQRALYVQYNTCREDTTKPFAAFVEHIREAIEDKPLDRFIVDLRHNSGGDSHVIKPLYDLIDRRDAPLYVLVGRATYSSGLLNAITLAEKYDGTLVGEPTSGKPNFFGETRLFRLPHSGYPGLYSIKRFETGDGDPPTLYPDVPVSVTADDYFAGRDPVLDTVLTDEEN